MSLLKIFGFILGMGLSQAIADTVRAAYGPGELAAAAWSLFAQFIVCWLLFVIIDGAPLLDSIDGAIRLTVFVRIFYFVKNLKKGD